ncbi:MAG TPA: SpoVG family protein [Candidatus Krumholzibacteria bacterium]|jgi:stage V sporulation protein G|nr:SpoVG family protein [Candidatus Krumholzibacteria bacterium]
MKITDIRVLLRDDEKLKAFVSVTFDNAFAVRGMKIIEGAKGTFLAMPSRKTPENVYVDVAFPINRETRAWLETHVMRAYEDAVRARANGLPDPLPPIRPIEVTG